MSQALLKHLKMKLRIAQEEDAQLWDGLIDLSPQGTLFHKWAWLRIMEKHTGAKLYPLIGFNGDVPVAVYPLFHKKTLFFSMVFSPPPHCAVLYLGPAIANYDTLKPLKREALLKDLQEAADEFISSRLKPDYILISTSPALRDIRPLKWGGYEVKPVYSYCLNIKNGSEAVWKGFGKHFKYSINKAKKDGVYVQIGSKEEVGVIYDLMFRRYQEQEKTVTMPKEYLLELYEKFPSNMHVYVAKYDGKIETGVIDLWYKERITSWLGNPKTRLEKIYPNDLLFWETIEAGCKAGCKEYEIIGAAGVERLYCYYSKCNPDLLLWFTARKYSSFLSKTMETVYVHLLKPLSAKKKLWSRKNDG